jgi:hypothetical protein
MDDGDASEVYGGGTVTADFVVLITSCEAYRHNGYNDAARETWIRTLACSDIPYKFLLGRASKEARFDELVLDADDSYDSTPYKVKAACQYFLSGPLTRAFFCDTDTYVVVPRLLAAGNDARPYVGHPIVGIASQEQAHATCSPMPVEFAQGGAGYWLDRSSAETLAKSRVLWKYSDLHVGETLRAAGVSLTKDTRYYPWGYIGSEAYPPDVISIHLSKLGHMPKYDPAWMRETHQRFLNGIL